MPQKSRFELPPLDLGNESLGKRLTRFRKERGLTQAQLAEKIGIIQALISDYERGRTRPHAEMIVRLALALEVSTDELLGLENSAKVAKNGVRFKFMKRLQKIEGLPAAQQKTLLRTIDAFIKAGEH